MMEIAPRTEQRTDDLWRALRAEGERWYHEAEVGDPIRMIVARLVLPSGDFIAFVARSIVRDFADGIVTEEALTHEFIATLRRVPELPEEIASDILAHVDRDPAANGVLATALFAKGFQAMAAHRIAHALYREGRVPLALYINARTTRALGVDIHPAARFGRGIFIDHATGVVVGETAVVGDNVSILQGVTLGGTGKEHGDRHPKIESGVLLGTGAKVLGNIVIGTNARIGAGSVVLRPVPPYCTAVGVPARVVRNEDRGSPAVSMDQSIPYDVPTYEI